MRRRVAVTALGVSLQKLVEEHVNDAEYRVGEVEEEEDD